ncbi:MAG: PilZ domain-containing protein [SAR324 cluster bacterium]|nr:PilZ domain-containing protein [SAR324 cluster bacterium]
MNTRSNDRHHLGGEIPIVDIETKEELGFVCDLSLTGMMIIGDEAPVKGQRYNLTLNLKEADGGPFNIVATCRWVKMGDLDDTLESGFLLEEPDENTKERMINIAQQYDFFGESPDLPDTE